MTDDEHAVLQCLAAAWNAYLMLPAHESELAIVGDDCNDFRKAIHDAQRIVMSRAVVRELES